MCTIKWTVVFCATVCVIECVKKETKQGFHYKDKENKAPGIFERFVRDVLFTLSSGFVKEKTLQQFLRKVEEELLQLEYKSTKKLAKIVRRIAKERDEITENLQEYIDALEDKGPKLREFLQAMDKVYSAMHAMRFNSYVQDLQDYGREAMRDINAETRKILRDVIIGGILERPHYVQKELHDKLKRAVKESY